MAERIHPYGKNPPTILFVDTQPRARISETLKLPPMVTWVADVARLPLDNVPTVNVAEGEPLPDDDDLDRIHGIYLGGSGKTITEPEPFMPKTLDFMHSARRAGVPQLAVCFSHHLIAGEVETRPEKRFGLKVVELTPIGRADPIHNGLPSSYSVFTSNDDVVTQKPTLSGVRVDELARSVHPFRDPNEVLVYHNPESEVEATVHSTQYHPELTAPIILALAEQYSNPLSPKRRSVKIIPEEIKDYDREIRARGQLLVGNWITSQVIPSRERRAKQPRHL